MLKVSCNSKHSGLSNFENFGCVQICFKMKLDRSVSIGTTAPGSTLVWIFCGKLYWLPTYQLWYSIDVPTYVLFMLLMVELSQSVLKCYIWDVSDNYNSQNNYLKKSSKILKLKAYTSFHNT